MSSLDELREIRALINKLDERVRRLEGLSQGPPQSQPESNVKSLPIREFILQKDVITDSDKTVVIGYFLEKFEKADQFNIDDLEKGFREAKERVPRNLKETVDKNIRRGYIMQFDEKDGRISWTLSKSGEAFVEKQLGGKSNG